MKHTEAKFLILSFYIYQLNFAQVSFFFGIYSVHDENELIYSADFGYDRTLVTFHIAAFLKATRTSRHCCSSSNPGDL